VSLEVVVHDGRAVQIERRERVHREDKEDRRPPDDRRRKSESEPLCSPDDRKYSGRKRRKG
jgi:hypothetical protein